MRAKLIRKIPLEKDLPWYFQRYEFECIECGEHYTRKRCDERTTPYCWKCQKKHDTEKARKAKMKKEESIKNAAIEVYKKAFENIRAEIEDFREETFHRTDTDYEAYAAVQYCLDILKKYMDGEK